MEEELFKVTGVIERRKVDELGKLIRYFEVHYQTTHGAIGTVEIPAEGFSAEKVINAITPIALELENLFLLGE